MPLKVCGNSAINFRSNGGNQSTNALQNSFKSVKHINMDFWKFHLLSDFLKENGKMTYVASYQRHL